MQRHIGDMEQREQEWKESITICLQYLAAHSFVACVARLTQDTTRMLCALELHEVECDFYFTQHDSSHERGSWDVLDRQDHGPVLSLLLRRRADAGCGRHGHQRGRQRAIHSAQLRRAEWKQA